MVELPWPHRDIGVKEVADQPNKDIREAWIVPGFRFSVIVPSPPMSHDLALDATDALASAGCTDASIRGHVDGMELLFDRAADSLQDAIASAFADVERAGFSVSKVELEREAIPG